MKEVPDKQILEDAATELNIDPSFIEKDWYVTQLIAEITRFRFMDAQFIFTGGTALTKAHRLIKRFSEDIDFRIASDTISSYSKSKQRKTLSELRKTILEHLEGEFLIDETLMKSRNDNRFMSFDIDYPTVFDQT